MVTSNGSFFFIFMQLAGKFGRIIRLATSPFGVDPPPPPPRDKMKSCWNSGGFIERAKYVKRKMAKNDFLSCRLSPYPVSALCWHELHFCAGKRNCRLLPLQTFCIAVDIIPYFSFLTLSGLIVQLNASCLDP